MDVDQIRQYARDRRNCSNYPAARAADAVADLREAYNLVHDARDRLSGADIWYNKQNLVRVLDVIVVQISGIVSAADLPAEMRL